MDAKEYIAAFDEVKADFEKSVAEFGLPFEAKETQLRETRVCVAEQCGCHCENGNASLWRNWISPACVACRTGERTATFFTSLKCSRHCYFCFNPNQEDYEYWLSHKRDIAGELREAHAVGAGFDCLAITGGEPLLFKSDVYAFLDGRASCTRRRTCACIRAAIFLTMRVWQSCAIAAWTRFALA